MGPRQPLVGVRVLFAAIGVCVCVVVLVGVAVLVVAAAMLDSSEDDAGAALKRGSCLALGKEREQKQRPTHGKRPVVGRGDDKKCVRALCVWIDGACGASGVHCAWQQKEEEDGGHVVGHQQFWGPLRTRFSACKKPLLFPFLSPAAIRPFSGHVISQRRQ